MSSKIVWPNSSIVEVDWLEENLNKENVILLEAKLKPINAPEDWESGFKIPGARLMDINESFSDKGSDLPHMLQNEDDFTKAARNLGINEDSLIVIYDQVGVYSSPRAWWMFKAMGHRKVFVLNGGLPQWRKDGKEVEKANWPKIEEGDFTATFDRKRIRSKGEVQEKLQKSKHLVLDARSKGRFQGTEAEPRIGLRGGHMPKAINLPFPEVLNGFKLKNIEDLNRIFFFKGAENKKLIMSCGSGVTASVLALAAEVAGYSNISVYDGSWAEWGMEGDWPVVC